MRMRTKIGKISAKSTLMTMCAVFLCISSYAQSTWSDYAAARNTIWEEKLEKQVGFLADSICQGRGIGTRGGVEAAAWIAREFEKARLKKMDGSWFKSFMSEKGQVGHNVVGLYHGGYADCDSYIIVGAHFDHIGNLGGK